MNEKILNENLLPNLPEMAKILITLGRWSMYEINYSGNEDVKYTLSSENNDYLLDSTGYALSILPERKEIEYLSRILFDVKNKINYIDISL